MKLKKGYRELLEEAEAEIDTIAASEVMAMLADENLLVVDIRDIREVQREGRVPGSFHAPRGMLEFWVDPDSPYYRDVFAGGRRIVFYCASGWRSALAAQTVQRMGLPHVAHMGGGFKAWKEAGGPVENCTDRKG